MSYLFAFSYCSWGSQGQSTLQSSNSYLFLLLEALGTAHLCSHDQHCTWHAVGKHLVRGVFSTLLLSGSCGLKSDGTGREQAKCNQIFSGGSGKESACNAGDLGSRREWQPTPLFLPGEFHGQRSLSCCSPWGLTECDTAEHALTLPGREGEGRTTSSHRKDGYWGIWEHLTWSLHLLLRTFK